MGGTNKSGLTQYCHVLLVRKYYPCLLAEATSERTFSDSGMFSSDKRKSLLPKNLSASVVCAKNEKKYPVAPLDLKKAHYK